MSVDELIAALLKLKEQGHGNKRVYVLDNKFGQADICAPFADRYGEVCICDN